MILRFQYSTQQGVDPANWNRGAWGTNDATFTYPVQGTDGASAAKVAMTTYTDGDAKWYFDDVTVGANGQYTYKESYTSTAASTFTVRFTLADNSTVYRDLATVPSSAGWSTFEYTFLTPANTTKVTVFHHLNAVGELTIDNASIKEYTSYVNQEQINALRDAGHEIGSHTKSHPHLPTLTDALATDEIAGSKSVLEGLGYTINTFVYPYGEHNAFDKTLAFNAGYTAARTTLTGFNVRSTDKYALLVQNVEVNTSIETIKAWIDEAQADKTWLILVFHQIDHSGDQYGTTPEILTQIVSYLQLKSVMVKTMGEMIPLMNP